MLPGGLSQSLSNAFAQLHGRRQRLWEDLSELCLCFTLLSLDPAEEKANTGLAAHSETTGAPSCMLLKAAAPCLVDPVSTSLG